MRNPYYLHGQAVSDDGVLPWSDIETTFRNRVMTGVVSNLRHVDPRRFLEDAEDTVIARVRNILRRHSCLKNNVVLNGEFVTGDRTGSKSIATRNHQLLGVTDLREWYGTLVTDAILAELDEFQERDSGWTLSRILGLTVNVNRFNPMHAGCLVDLPRKIRNSHAVINARSRDNACFAWAVVAALYPVQRNATRCAAYP